MAKRALDIGVSVLALWALSPLLLLAAAAVKLESPGPALYRGRRVGRGGADFQILKLRTMRVGSDLGLAVTVAGDSRVTRIGRLLRRSKLDELPQLLNVLRGDMSLVGPRPEHPDYVALYSERQRAVLKVRPGITSRASIAYVDEEERLAGADPEHEYRTRIMPAKLALEVEYLERASLREDMRILVDTVLQVAARAGRRRSAGRG